MYLIYGDLYIINTTKKPEVMTPNKYQFINK